jgi:hypothetical protein
VEDLDREVLALLAEYLPALLLEDLAGPVVRVDDVVTDLELDVLDLTGDLEVLELLFGCFGNGAPLLQAGRRLGATPRR